MRKILSTLLLTILLSGCATTPNPNVIATGVAGTQTALASSTIQEVAPLQPTEFIPPDPIQPTSTDSLPIQTIAPPTPTDTPLPTSSFTAGGQIGQQIPCNNSLIVTIPKSPEFIKDLFEHHAVGTFLIIKVELLNTTNQPIQIWDGDYSIESELEGKIKAVSPHRAATTYLYIQRGGKLVQDKVEPGVTNWEANVAFDVDPEGTNWVFVFKPGSENGQTLCELRINLVSTE